MGMDTTGAQMTNGFVATMINNDSYYPLGQRAIVVDANNGKYEEMTFITNVNGRTYTILYNAAIDHFLDHISQFNVMAASFSINAMYLFSTIDTEHRLYDPKAIRGFWIGFSALMNITNHHPNTPLLSVPNHALQDQLADTT